MSAMSAISPSGSTVPKSVVPAVATIASGVAAPASRMAVSSASGIIR